MSKCKCLNDPKFSPEKLWSITDRLAWTRVFSLTQYRKQESLLSAARWNGLLAHRLALADLLVLVRSGTSVSGLSVYVMCIFTFSYIFFIKAPSGNSKYYIS